MNDPAGPTSLLRVGRWAVVVLPVLDLVLVLAGPLDRTAGVVLGLAIEAMLAGVLVAEATAFRRAYRAARSTDCGRRTAVSAGLTAALPAPIGWFLRIEAGSARALWWAVRRRSAVEPGDVVLPYTDRIGVLLWTTAGLGVVEVAVVHLLVPWTTVRWVLLALGVYGELWVVALAFSLRQHPHVVRNGELLLRFAHFRTTRVPLHGLVGARHDVRNGHKHNVELAEHTLSLSVAGETALELTFEPPVDIEVRGRMEQVTRVRLFADDPRAAVRVLRTRTSSGRGES